MRWPQRPRTEIRGVIDRFQIYDHILAQSRTKMRGAGSPCTYFRNTSITFYGTAPTNETKCYCWTTGDKNQPDRNHFVCMGTGYLSGYQKYGYHEHTVTTTSTVTKDAFVVISGERNSKFIISSPTQTQGTITTERFSLERFREVDRFLATESTQADQNRIRYYYSTDDTTWTQITMTAYTTNRLGNKQGSFSLPQGTEYIRFRIVLQKKAANSLSPEFNSIKFRYRKQRKLIEIDPRFPIDIPAFLAAREQQTVEIKQDRDIGWTTDWPLWWWTLPEAGIKDSDIIMFLQGAFANRYFEIQSLTPYVHGPDLRVLHNEFKTSYLRDKDDIIKVLDLLS